MPDNSGFETPGYNIKWGTTAKGDLAGKYPAPTIKTGVIISEAIRVVTISGNITGLSTDYIIVVNKTVGEATVVTLPIAPTIGFKIIVKDGKGDAGDNPITLSGTIDGLPGFVIGVPYGSLSLVYNGTQYNII